MSIRLRTLTACAVPEVGTVTYGKHDVSQITDKCRRTDYVSQEHGLLPGRTV